MTPSTRIASLNGTGDDGWGLYMKARDMAAAGHPVTMLTIGDHDRTTPAEILDAMNRSARGGHTGYASVPGTDSLRDIIAKRVTDPTGMPTTRENVLVTPGGQAGLFAAMMGVADPGDPVVFLDPYYATYPGTIRAASATPRAVEMQPEHGFQPERSALQTACAGAKALLINTPNNPTGAVYSSKTLNDIAAVCQAQDIWLISDEVYDTQVWEGQHISPRVLDGMRERTLVIGSLSKSHMMTGSRLGWIIGPAPMIAHLTDLATNTTYGVPGYIQDAAAWALSEGDHIETYVARTYAARRTAALEVLRGSNSVTVSPNAGGMYLMLDIRKTGLSGEDFADALLMQHGIAVMPGESFGNAAAGHLRVALTVPEPDLIAALRTLVAFAETRVNERAAS